GRGVLGVERWVMIKAVPLLDAAGTTTAVITVMSDLTERRRAEEEVRRSRDELDAILRGIADGLYVQTMDGEMLYANQAAAEMLGYDTAEELIASPLATRNDRIRILDEHGEPIPLDALPNRRIWRGETYAEALVRARYRDGSERWGIVKAVPLRDGSGTPNAVIVVLNDITERRRAEELQRQAENLSRSNAALQEFAYVASHDLQEPLRMVASYTQLLQRRYRGKLDSDADEFIGYAVDGARRMKRLITDLLAYSRVETQGRPPGPVDCGAVLAEVRENLRVAIEDAGAEIAIEPLPVIAGDRTQIGQLLQNLLGNAIKFRGQRSPRIGVTVQREQDHWRFAVEDNGIGVPPEFAERIFGAFQRLHTRDEYEGSGIGLAVCKKIVERHGGRIWVEPGTGGGARFCFTLPALAAVA
ncbi:MAG TPA: ATP-binding protein, partial [Dehalococcoidia bacterium]|nr:ATP-binding protein [Dehalococcoidia bacterium]